MSHHLEIHRSHRIGWLRAAVLGANDGIVSTASLLIGVIAAGASMHEVLVAGVAGLVAGAMSMAAGEYVSVSSQADTQAADLDRERKELAADEEHETEELATIYVGRGLEYGLARQVAEQLMAHDALGSHAREELGISHIITAQPIQAAFASGITFAAGAGLPMLTVVLAPEGQMIPIIAVTSLGFLALLGGLSASAGGASLLKAAVRVTFWGSLAMGVTAAIGHLSGSIL